MARYLTCDACRKPIEDEDGSTWWRHDYPVPTLVGGLTARVSINVKNESMHDADLHRTCAEAIFAATLAAMRLPAEVE